MNDQFLKRRKLLAYLVIGPSALSFAQIKFSWSATDYKRSLYSPTQIVKLYGTYFIVDCWHHRILYSKIINKPISDWSILDDNLGGPHSIASNGSLFVTEDTGRHSINVYYQVNQKFKLKQRIPNIGIRPHRVIYDINNEQFLIVGSIDQSIHILKQVEEELVVIYSAYIKELNGQYCRSITIKENLLYFVGVNDICIFELKRNHVGSFVKKIKLYKNYTDNNDLFFTGKDKGFLTSSQKKIFSFESLKELENGTAVDQSNLFKGAPYYIESFDGKLFIPEIIQYNAISYFQQNNNKLENKKMLFDFGPPSNASIARKSELPV